MDKRDVLKILDRFKGILEVKGIRVKKVVLFGSYATNTFGEGSDIDTIVISDDFEDKDFWERIEILSDAIYEIFEPIEAIAMTSEEWEKEDSPIVSYARNGEVLI